VILDIDCQAGWILRSARRDYWAFTGRWLQPDDVDGRRYTYVGGDPLNQIDPSGHGGCDPTAMACSEDSGNENGGVATGVGGEPAGAGGGGGTTAQVPTTPVPPPNAPRTYGPTSHPKAAPQPVRINVPATQNYASLGGFDWRDVNVVEGEVG
jgi:hypothetical protein